jgi:hypothetical protein
LNPKLSVLFIFCFLFITAFSQERYTLSGYVRSAADGEELIGATVAVKALNTGVSSNVYGFYSLSLPEGNYQVSYSYIGYEEKTIEIELKQNIQQNIELSEMVNELETVEITDEAADKNVESIEMSVNKIDAKTIKKIPALLGEADVVRSILLLPGVSTVGEGSTGFNVRGGGIDQNLVLLDEAPVYNSSHLFGFFSVFNPDAVKNVKLIKGGIAPEYGGRLSSILDIRMKEGNKKEFEGNGGVGLIFSRLALEGPLVKDKASFIVAGRRSYADILAKPFLDDNLEDSRFYFYDLTAKVNYELNQKNRLFLSGYFGRDVFGSGFLFNWGNATATARWNHIFNDRLFMNLTAYYSDYDYAFGVEEDDPDDDFEWNSSIVSYSVKPDLSYYIDQDNTLSFGGQSIYYDFKPAEARFASDGQSNDISLPEKFAMENAVYIQNEQSIGARTRVLYGFRISNFNYLGDGVKQTFNDTTPGVRRTLIEDERFDQNEIIASYFNFEPRASIKYDLTEFSSVKASYNRMAQYLHLISNTIASTPIDIWLPTTNNIKPQLADQVALGYFRNFKNNTYEASAELFAKDFQNQVDYIDNADIFFNDELEADLLSGEGRAYGLELFVKKSKGQFTGWVSYTLSRSERKVEGINNGEWYPNRFDRLHNTSVVGNYEWNDKWSFSANFVFSTGTPATFPTNRYEIQGIVIPHNAGDSRNNYRIPSYHRLDLSATLTPRSNADRKWKSEWVFSVYNVYNRRNPFAIFFETQENNPRVTQAIRYSVIGNFVPAVSYNFKF